MSPKMKDITETDGCQTVPANRIGWREASEFAQQRDTSLQCAATKYGSNKIPLAQERGPLENKGARPKSRPCSSQKEESRPVEETGGYSYCKCNYKENKRKPKGKHYSLPIDSSTGFVNTENCPKCKGSKKYTRNEDSLSSEENVCELSYSVQACSSQDCYEENLHKYPKFQDYSTRRMAFVVFVFPIFQLVEKLIDAGFVYSGKGDVVTCYSCGQTQSGWSASDDPWTRHAQLNPECQHIKESQASGTVKQSSVVKSYNKAIQTYKRPDTIEETQGETDDAQTILPASKPASISKPDEDRLRRENEQLRNDKLCKVCLSDDVSVVFLPCSHLVCCLECSNGLNDCPVCRAQIKASVRVHRPMV